MKFSPAVRGIAGMVASEVQEPHALVKSIPEFSPVARKDVREVMPYHVLVKLVPAVRAKAGKVARAVQFCHAPKKLVPESKPVARKEVRAVLPYHA